MSAALYRMGRYAARRPWRVIGAWLVITVVIVSASAMFGRELRDTQEAPGLDSQRAADLLAETDSAEGGLTAQVVLTPPEGAGTFFDSPAAVAAVGEVQAALAGLADVRGTSDTAGALEAGRAAAVETGSVSPDGRVALISVQYPQVDELDAGDLAALNELGAE
ncbi:MAG: MMPL family transporter, partial [Actinomycetota bacterium]